MIGKNVNIRRARGRFVLSTNIDIISSNEPVDYLASRSRTLVLHRTDSNLARGVIFEIEVEASPYHPESCVELEMLDGAQRHG
jgi:hypothetical protein